MADMLQSGSLWLARQLAAHAGQAAVYRRGTDSVAVTVTLGKTEYELLRADGVVEKQVCVDFLVMATSLVLDGVTVLPARGDLIEAGSQQFEVLALPGEREYRPSDPQGILLRIHTKLRKAEP